MNLESILTIAFVSAGTLLIGGGVASKDPGWAAVSVGVILLSIVVAAKFAGRRE